jgi:hypothetical protein
LDVVLILSSDVDDGDECNELPDIIVDPVFSFVLLVDVPIESKDNSDGNR